MAADLFLSAIKKKTRSHCARFFHSDEEALLPIDDLFEVTERLLARKKVLEVQVDIELVIFYRSLRFKLWHSSGLETLPCKDRQLGDYTSNNSSITESSFMHHVYVYFYLCCVSRKMGGKERKSSFLTGCQGAFKPSMGDKLRQGFRISTALGVTRENAKSQKNLHAYVPGEGT